MIAYKFLRPGAVGPFSRLHWPTPSGSGPGEWVVAEKPLRGCTSGIHAARLPMLPYWLAEELWVTELEAPILDEGRMVLGHRGRLIERVAAWNSEAASAFGNDCARQAKAMADEARSAGGDRELVSTHEGYAADSAEFARKGSAGTAAYVAAHAAGCLQAGGRTSGAAYLMGAETERARQALWLADQLGLGDRE